MSPPDGQWDEVIPSYITLYLPLPFAIHFLSKADSMVPDKKPIRRYLGPSVSADQKESRLVPWQAVFNPAGPELVAQAKMALKNMAAASRASEEDASLAVKVTLGVCFPENARLALLPVSPAGSHMPAAALMLASPSDDAPSRLSDLVANMLEVPPEFLEFNLWSGRIPRLEQGGPGLD